MSIVPVTTTSTGRKIRGDAKLERLTPEQRERLRVWLDNENRTYAEVVQLIRTEFSLAVGKSAVACYWQRHVLPTRYDQIAEDAVEVADLPETKFSEAGLKLVRMHAYTALASSEPDLKTAARLLETVRSADRLALARERFAFDQRRAALREEQVAEKRQAEEAKKIPPFDYNFANIPLPRASDGVLVGGWPPAPQNLPLFPGSAAFDRPKSGEKNSPSSPQPSHTP